MAPDVVPPTHRELCTVAAKWLRRKGYSNAVAEPPLQAYENPDAIGWGRVTAVIECKTGRADFKRDRKKSFRHPNAALLTAMGDYRWYMAPRGLLNPDDLPDGWGLLEVYGATRRTRETVKAECFLDRDVRAVRVDMNALAYVANRLMRYDDFDRETLRFRPIQWGAEDASRESATETR